MVQKQNVVGSHVKHSQLLLAKLYRERNPIGADKEEMTNFKKTAPGDRLLKIVTNFQYVSLC